MGLGLGLALGLGLGLGFGLARRHLVDDTLVVLAADDGHAERSIGRLVLVDVVLGDIRVRRQVSPSLRRLAAPRLGRLEARAHPFRLRLGHPTLRRDRCDGRGCGRRGGSAGRRGGSSGGSAQPLVVSWALRCPVSRLAAVVASAVRAVAAAALLVAVATAPVAAFLVSAASVAAEFLATSTPTHHKFSAAVGSSGSLVITSSALCTGGVNTRTVEMVAYST